MSLWEAIGRDISAVTGNTGEMAQNRSVSGGCINETVRAHFGDHEYFVKLNEAGRIGMFDAEALGLQEIIDSGAVRAPLPVCRGKHGNRSYLVLEYLPLGGRGSHEELGRALARMHENTRDVFGWEHDNTIGSTPQINSTGKDWVGFWREQRLGYQLQLAERNGYGGSLQERGGLLLEEFQHLFEGYLPAASLLHGALWSGNYSFTRAGEPVIYDPAVYFGDRETDIAMSELFGGFGHSFYAAYREAWPLDAGYPVRRTLYNLYHILNHLNLFGGGYLPQAQGMIDTLLGELR